MQVAIALGTLLLGGWVLNSPVDEDESGVTEQQTQPPATVPAMEPRRPMTDRGQGSTVDRGQGSTKDRGQRRTHGGSASGDSMPDSQSGRARRQGTLDMVLAPTDSVPAGAEGMLGQPAAPTSNIPLTDVSRAGAGMERPSGSFGSHAPSAPTSRRESSSSSGFRPMSHGSSDQSRHAQAPSGTANFMTPPASVDKAFSGYRAPSGVSPYMNLFRREGDGVNNYQSLVRPQLDQRFLNQQIGQDIRGLERNTRMQGMQLNQQSRTLQGVGTPQYYMNYGD